MFIFTTYYFRYTLAFCFFTLVTSSNNYSPSFMFKNFDHNSKYFWSHIMLLGDASLVQTQNSSFVQITSPWNYSSGGVMYKQAFKLSDPNPNRIKKLSFGTYFVFSLSPSLSPVNGYGNGLSFVLDTNGSVDPVVFKLGRLNNGKKLQCWIDYESGSRRIEVRVSDIGERRPVNPVISREIDLSTVFSNKEVYIGLSASNGDTTQVCRLYSWSFKLRKVPSWMHSQPLDPQGFKKEAKPVEVVIHKRSDCLVRVFTALVFGTGCGALGAFIVLCVCSVFVSKKPAAVAPEEFVVQPVEFDCDKVKVIVIDKADSGKK